MFIHLFDTDQKKNIWVDGKRTRKNPIKGGMNLDKGEDEGIFICMFNVITHPAAKCGKKNKYKRESSLTKCEKKQVVR